MASKLTMLLQVVAGLSWTTLPANGVFDTVPAEVGGVLSACSGDMISIKCGHTNTGSGVTRWIFSPPVDCSEIIEHRRPNDRQCGSSPFRFQQITSLTENVILSSTAVATANTTMTDTTVQCQDTAGISPMTIGNVTVCIFDHPTDIIVSNTENGVIIRWTFEFISHIPCNGSASFKVVISKSDGDNSTVNKTTADTRVEFNNLIAGQEYSAVVTTVLSSCSTDSEMTNFTFMASDPQSGSGKGSTLSTGEIIAIVIVIVITICLAIIFLILSVVLIFKRKKSKVRDDKSSGTTPICDESETCRKDSLIKENKGHEAFGMKNNGHHDEAEVKKDYPKGISDEPFIQRANEKELDPARIGGSTREKSVNQQIKMDPARIGGSTRETSINKEIKMDPARRGGSTRETSVNQQIKMEPSRRGGSTRETSVDKGGKTELAGRGRSTTRNHQSVNKKKNESHPRSGLTSRDPSINKEKKTGPGSNDGSTTAQSFNKEKRPEHFPIGKSIGMAQPEKTDPSPGVSDTVTGSAGCVQKIASQFEGSVTCTAPKENYDQNTGSLYKRGPTPEFGSPVDPSPPLHSTLNTPNMSAANTNPDPEIHAGKDQNKDL